MDMLAELAIANAAFAVIKTTLANGKQIADAGASLGKYFSAEKAIAKGYKVFVACQDTGRSIEIKKKDIEFIDLTISRSGINPFKEFSTLIDFYKTVKILQSYLAQDPNHQFQYLQYQ